MSIRWNGWLALFLLGANAAVAAPLITSVEPPNWWAGHSLNPVRVLIHGSGLAGAAVAAPAGLTPGAVSISANGAYLFVDVTIAPGTKPGNYPLQIRTAAGSAVAPFRLEEPLPDTNRFQGFSPDDVIYLIMPDRFANGDTSNDDPAVSRGLFGRQNSHFYHGGDLQGLIDHLPYLKELGVTALWLTPLYNNNDHLGSDPSHSATNTSDYHGYGAVDYYAVEEHFGNLNLLRALVDAAHKIGIKVIQDQVANHVGPAHPWVHDPPTPTWFNGTLAHHLKETFNVWNLIDPHASDNLVQPVLNGWFADVLPDLNQADPEVAKYEIQNALWWIGVAGFDGVRQDTLPYVPRTFWAQWSAALKRQYPHLRVVGEVLDPNPAITSFFQAGSRDSKGVDTGIDTLFDYPVYFSLREAFTHDMKLEPLIKAIANDRLYPDPASLVTILGDHDVARFMNEPGASIEGLKLAFAFLLTARGTPVIYYGDELGMQGGEDPDNRRDFPGGWRGDSQDAFRASGRTPQQSAMFDHVKKLLAMRAQSSPLRRGEMISLFESSQMWVYARRDGTGTVVVAINSSGQPADAAFHLPAAEGIFRNLLEATAELTVSGNTATVHLAARSAAIYDLTNGKT